TAGRLATGAESFLYCTWAPQASALQAVPFSSRIMSWPNSRQATSMASARSSPSRKTSAIGKPEAKAATWKLCRSTGTRSGSRSSMAAASRSTEFINAPAVSARSSRAGAAGHGLDHRPEVPERRVELQVMCRRQDEAAAGAERGDTVEHLPPDFVRGAEGQGVLLVYRAP